MCVPLVNPSDKADMTASSTIMESLANHEALLPFLNNENVELVRSVVERTGDIHIHVSPNGYSILLWNDQGSYIYSLIHLNHVNDLHAELYAASEATLKPAIESGCLVWSDLWKLPTDYEKQLVVALETSDADKGIHMGTTMMLLLGAYLKSISIKELRVYPLTYSTVYKFYESLAEHGFTVDPIDKEYFGFQYFSLKMDSI